MEDGVSLIYGMKFKNDTCLLAQSCKNSFLSTNHRRKKQWGKNQRRFWIVHRAVWHCSIKNATNTGGTYTVGVLELPCGTQLYFRTMSSPENMLSSAPGNSSTAVECLVKAGGIQQHWCLCQPNTWMPKTVRLGPDAVIPGRLLGPQQEFWCIKERSSNGSKQLWWCLIRFTSALHSSWKSSLEGAKGWSLLADVGDTWGMEWYLAAGPMTIRGDAACQRREHSGAGATVHSRCCKQSGPGAQQVGLVQADTEFNLLHNINCLLFVLWTTLGYLSEWWSLTRQTGL